ncbi:hypothetical protein Bpfe_031076 [Biomphalaria pfeifferi]|uniref:Uncharacterized protein n=1 Tax=Biomphalaria pfeifferi TaxID=112525 RepID=A0AAD8AQ51_BIOPF|nr:hypothetical protein Bpfe_031076 [Biomphalaria pfeifferi]
MLELDFGGLGHDGEGSFSTVAVFEAAVPREVDGVVTELANRVGEVHHLKHQLRAAERGLGIPAVAHGRALDGGGRIRDRVRLKDGVVVAAFVAGAGIGDDDLGHAGGEHGARDGMLVEREDVCGMLVGVVLQGLPQLILGVDRGGGGVHWNSLEVGAALPVVGKGAQVG